MTTGQKPALPDFEEELRKVPGLTEDEIDTLAAMATAGFEYGVELQRRRRERGLVPVCHYTGKACQYTGSLCTCLLPGFVGTPPKDWVPAKGADGEDELVGWSSDRPNANGLWLWREGGKAHREVKLVLCSGGREVADPGLGGEREESAQTYWCRTPTDQRNMPGLWKRAEAVVGG